MLRPAAAVVVIVSVLLAAMPALAEEAFNDSSAWWVQATAEGAPEKFHLLPDDNEKPRDWGGLARDTAFLLTYQVIGVGVIYVLPASVSRWSDSAKNNIGFETMVGQRQ